VKRGVNVEAFLGRWAVLGRPWPGLGISMWSADELTHISSWPQSTTYRFPR